MTCNAGTMLPIVAIRSIAVKQSAKNAVRIRRTAPRASVLFISVLNLARFNVCDDATRV